EWLEEDGSIDEEVQHQIINGVKNAISKDCLAKVEKTASTEIDKAINESIGIAKETIADKAVRFADEWLEKEVTITDKWGDTVECLTIIEIIKNQFGRLLEQKVDSRGNFTTSTYGGGIRLIDYLTGSKVEKIVNEKLKGIDGQIDGQVTKEINKGIRENVSNKFAEMVVNVARHDNQQLKQLENEQ
ncbi:MAG: hypothetical protein GY810_00395, partial [Aureispira sp.]|nr:hypothetical protein [Aureispira sp.]